MLYSLTYNGVSGAIVAVFQRIFSLYSPCMYYYILAIYLHFHSKEYTNICAIFILTNIYLVYFENMLTFAVNLHFSKVNVNFNLNFHYIIILCTELH